MKSKTTIWGLSSSAATCVIQVFTGVVAEGWRVTQQAKIKDAGFKRDVVLEAIA